MATHKEISQRCSRKWLSWHDYHKQGKQSLEGEAGAGGEWYQPDRRRAGHHVCAGAEPAPAGADQGGDPAAEAAPTHPEEPRLRSQLPGEARHPEGGAGEAESPAAAGGRQAGHGERQHESGARRAALQVRGPAELRQDCGTQPRHLHQGAHGLRHRAPGSRTGGGHQRHHHRQVQNGGQVIVAGGAVPLSCASSHMLLSVHSNGTQA